MQQYFSSTVNRTFMYKRPQEHTDNVFGYNFLQQMSQ